MKDIKKTIIILTSILVILMVIIIVILMKLKDVEIEESISEGNDTINGTDIVEETSLKRVDIRNNYYTVKNIVDQYYSALCSLNKTTEDILIFEEDENTENLEETIAKEKESTKKRIYNFFDENCTKEIGLTTNNIQEKLGNYKDLHVLIEDMYVKDITTTLKMYFVSGTITEKENSKSENFRLVIALDSNNSTFNLYTLEYSKKYNFEEENKVFDISEIENRTYNKYKNAVIDDETHAKELLKSYTQPIIYNDVDFSYDRLNEEYKTNKFGEMSDYKKYIQENRKVIIGATLKNYKINIYEGYKQYICIDQKGNYYIFNETTTMNYDLMLDIYTIDLPEFIEKYQVATNEAKVTLNVQKIQEALNHQDYKYLYNKLDATFRSNKFPTVNDLETYIKNNFFENNSVEYLELIQEGDIYIYKAKIKEKAFNIIMKLKEGTDFVFSFSVQ